MAAIEYVGDELDLFASAVNWKRYWLKVIAPYLGAEVLDVGAGLGSTAELMSALAFRRYLALEPDPDHVRRMNVNRNRFTKVFEAKQGTLEDLDKDQSFDTILYVDVLEHIEHDREELIAASRLLDPGGRLIILSPAHEWLFTPFDHAVGHVRRYTIGTLGDIKPEMLEIEKLFYLDSVGLLASLANKIILRQGQPTLAQIRLWDRLMVPLSRVTDPLLGHRIGKSVLAVMRKKDL